jgi:hypothetical protein
MVSLTRDVLGVICDGRGKSQDCAPCLADLITEYDFGISTMGMNESYRKVLDISIE